MGNVDVSTASRIVRPSVNVKTVQIHMQHSQKKNDDEYESDSESDGESGTDEEMDTVIADADNDMD